MKCKNCKNHCKRTDDDGTLYGWCGLIVDCPDPDLERDCKYFKTASNADKIRAMTDEELADWLKRYLSSNAAPHANARGATHKGKLVDWLKQEAEE